MTGRLDRCGRCGLCLAAYLWAAWATAAAPRAVDEIVRDSGVAAGLVVHLGTTDGQLETALAQGGRRLVHGLAADEDSLRTARKTIEDAGLYGLASVIAHRGDGRLPYRDNLVNLLIVSDWDGWAKKGLTEEELLRVVAPQGVLCLGREGKWNRRIKPRSAEMDEWRNQKNEMSGTLISRDSAFRPPFEMRWVDGPICGVGPSTPPSKLLISGGGKVYTLSVMDAANIGKTEIQVASTSGLVLVARDAFNGIRLWSDGTPGRNPNLMCAVGSYLFEGKDGEVVAYSSDTGERKFAMRAAGRILSISSDGDALYIASSGKGASAIEAFGVEKGEPRWKLDQAPGGKFHIHEDTLYALDGKDLAAVDLKTGKQRWTTTVSIAVSGMFICKQAVILQPKKTKIGVIEGNSLAAHSTKDGRLLWTLPIPEYKSAFWPVFPWKDAVAINGSLHDANAGKLISAAPKVQAGNCTPPIVTPNLTISPGLICRVGADPKDDIRFEGLRLQCGLGGMVANGMIYSAPSICGCSASGRVFGYPAFGAAGVGIQDADFVAPRPVIKGPGADKPLPVTSGEWPTYRHDAMRSSCTTAPSPRELKIRWKSSLGALPQGPVALNWKSRLEAGLTGTTVSSGLVYVADSETHRVLALSAADGQTKWTFRADGRVDSPPTIVQGRCVFGSHDGWVYCLRADDGRLIWRARAAPAEQFVVAFGQLESAWPVFGSVGIEKGLVYASAGRVWDVDGGIAFCAFKLEDGSTAWARKKGTRNDLMVSDGEAYYVGKSRFSNDGDPTDKIPPWSDETQKRGAKPLLGAYYGLLDASLTLFPPWSANSWTFRKAMFGNLYAWDNEEGFTWTLGAGTNPKVLCLSQKRFENSKKGAQATPGWSLTLTENQRIDALILTSDALVVGAVDNAKSHAPKGVVRTYSRSDGKQRQEVELPGIPAFQSLSAMPGRVFVTTTDGHLVCLGE